MATTVPSSFEKFKANLEITTLQQTTVSTRQQSVRDAVAQDLKVLDSFVTGSYKRHTMIQPLSEADIDVFVVLDPSYYASNGYATLLDRVRAALLKTYTKTPKVSRNGQAVTITFTDFIVDVVPGFHRQGGGYLIPSTAENCWIPTNPKVHETLISNANALHGGDLVPLVKMMKSWNREIGRGFKSFYLELLVQDLLQNVTISDLSSGCRYVFDKGREAIKYKITDPAGFGDQINPLAGVGTVTEAVSRFATALGRAQTAEAFARAGRVADAIGEWRKVFGDSFPIYG